MKFSLINIVKSSGPLVSGSWIQNHVGSLASAREVTRATEGANHGRIEITVAVVPELSSTTPALGFYTNLRRLDIESLPSALNGIALQSTHTPPPSS
jgi:hypothetical protein